VDRLGENDQFAVCIRQALSVIHPNLMFQVDDSIICQVSCQVSHMDNVERSVEGVQDTRKICLELISRLAIR
jgi:hypothetical protein